MLTTLTHGQAAESSSIAISSLIDTWLLLRNVESDAERNRLLFVIKSRGTAHSNQVREFLLTDRGAQLQEVSVGPRGVLTGSARTMQAAQDRAAEALQAVELERRRQTLARRAQEVEAQIVALQEQLSSESADLAGLEREESRGEDARAAAQAAAGLARQSIRDEGAHPDLAG